VIGPRSGAARLFGRDPMVDGSRALDGVAGFVEAPRFYPYLSGRTNLELVAGLDGGDAARHIDEALDTVDLTDRAKHKVGGYSHGMRQRLGIAGALIRRPRLLLLDEPTTGLDPAGMRDMRQLVRSLAQAGITVLLSSHLMAEVEEVCNRVAIVRSGRIVFEGGLDGLRGDGPPSFRLATADDARAAALCAGVAGVELVARQADGLHLTARDGAVEALTIVLGEARIGIRALVPLEPSLEERFLALTEDQPAEPAPARRLEAVA
jgi:ABC-2 type transport system ATP-binding protein